MNTASTNAASLGTDTLFGGRLLTVTHEDGATQEIKVRQLRLQDYARALQLVEDEFALAAFLCQTVPKSVTDGATTATPAPEVLEKPWVLTLHPESYEALLAATMEVNASGFFVYAARVGERNRKAKEEIVRSMANMPAETLKAVSEMASASKPSSPRPRPISR